MFSETLTDELRVPVELPKKKNAIEPAPVVESDETPIGPIVVPPPRESARRYYFVVPVSPRGREGPPSDVVSVPFGEPSMRAGTAGHRLHRRPDDPEVGAAAGREDLDDGAGRAAASAATQAGHASR